ncbi:hypothetical protein ACVR0S_00185 [Streptococcus dentapri]|uniref:Proline--tRNA ligase n=1 Tax=Streptococcus dentapri TaxID=573564 RepID=A0ABV8D240_9STRE
MRMKRLGIKTSYNRGEEEALSQEILIQSSQLKRHSAGIYGLGPLILKARNNVINIIKDTLEKYNCVEVSLPTLQPKQIWAESGRF